MVDINKYLETQLALAKQHTKNKIDKKNTVSQKSKQTAELISKKQQKNLNINIENEIINKDAESSSDKPNRSTDSSDHDSDFLPSENEDNVMNLPSVPSASRPRKNIKKIVDDGDTNSYNDRVANWRKDLADVFSGKYEGNCSSADIMYVLNGHKDPQSNHELQNGLCIPNYLWKQLYKYQRTGVKWLWELHQVQSGGLLGDEMGLGKTVQIIAFLAGLSKSDVGVWGGLGPSIIVAPATVIYQWVSHFHHWYPPLRVAVLHHTGSHGGNYKKLICNIHSSHGVLLVTYAGIMKYSKDLMFRKWHYIILDEGHKIRNPETQVSKLVKKFETPHRLLITGSPMQNSLQELWSLFDFMSPGLLGTYTAFMEYFSIPITQGGYANATQFQEATALEIALALKNIITPYMLRRTKAEVQEHIQLPEKNEQVLLCALTQEQRDLYMGYLMSGTVRSIIDKDINYSNPARARILVALSTLRKICNHPDLYIYEAQDDLEHVDENTFGYWKRSGKMTVVHSLLKIWQKQGHRALIFSQSRAMLCILEQHLQNQQYKYLKMDGSVSVSQRQNMIKTFNENDEYLVFLATTRVGGLGVNLTGADRVIIYDPDWNPATDSQAKERAWRIGQQRNVTVYRLLSVGTIEEKIYQRQIFKVFLGNKILTDSNQKNVLSTSTLQGLFTLDEPNCDGDTETASLFKHTKVNIKSKSKDKNDLIHLSGSVSFSKQKLDAMRKAAKEISKKISADAKSKELEENPREKYKKKRELLLNPPNKVDEPEINFVDNKITNVPFEDVLSELDIINMHVKKDYEENFIKDTLKNLDEIEEGEVTDDIEEKKIVSKESCLQEENVQECFKSDLERDLKLKDTNKKISKISKKRRVSSDNDLELDNLLVVKKHKKSKKHKSRIKQGEDDDYVLSKLFAKAGVKNALQHDAVVGLVEKEKKHKMKVEATKIAKDAVRAIKLSAK